jgi:hypothetical protein
MGKDRRGDDKRTEFDLAKFDPGESDVDLVTKREPLTKLVPPK